MKEVCFAIAGEGPTFGHGKHIGYALRCMELFASAAHLCLPNGFGAGEFASENLGGEWEIR
jgi:hypothetical protein